MLCNWLPRFARQTYVLHRSISFSSRRRDLNEFFDVKENLPEVKVSVGRPWKPSDLRMKKNVDLHKLWYVLLKERNMLMTMQEEYDRLNEAMPNPERFEKVEESMYNLLFVVEERETALRELENPPSSPLTSGVPEVTWTHNLLGRPVKHLTEEHAMPPHLNADYVDRRDGLMWSAKTTRRLREFRQIETEEENKRKAVENRKRNYTAQQDMLWTSEKDLQSVESSDNELLVEDLKELEK